MADFAFTFPLVLAQDDQAAPVAPGAAGPSVPVTGTGAGTGAGGTAAPGSPPTQRPGLFDQQFFLLIMLLVLGMIVFSIMGQRRDRKKREALISAVKKHDRVQTIGGVIGSVVEVKPDYVVLKVDESSNTRITFSRAAIAQVLTASPEPAAGKPDQPAT